MKKIRLAKGKFTLVDDDDYERVSQYSWTIISNQERAGYAYTMMKIDGKYFNVRLHRFIMNALKGTFVDHKNGDTFDNRKENLRFCTKQQNTFNTRWKKDSLSGYKGVDYHPCQPKKPWRARIMCGSKSTFIGQFATKEEAAQAYNAKAKELHGEFARLNIIEPKSSIQGTGTTLQLSLLEPQTIAASSQKTGS